MPRFRSSRYIAAPSDANFGSKGALASILLLVPLIDLKFLNELAAAVQELQIGGTSAAGFFIRQSKMEPRHGEKNARARAQKACAKAHRKTMRFVPNQIRSFPNGSGTFAAGKLAGIQGHDR